MRATESIDGCKRFTVRISYRVGLYGLASALACEMYFGSRRGEDEYKVGKWSREGLMSLVREGLQSEGYRHFQAVDECPEVEACYERAKAIVLFAFPEFAGESGKEG